MTKLDSLVVTEDLILLDSAQRVQFYIQVCEAHGLNPLTRPLQYFEQIDRNGKRNLILYALRGAAAQLAKNHSLSSLVTNQNPTFVNDIAVFQAIVENPTGRNESAFGVVSLKGLVGKEYADAIMAAQTKAKRRAILDFAGSGMLDESEVDGMRGSIVEVTDADLSGYVPIPPAPIMVPSPSVEVVASPTTHMPNNFDPKIIEAGNAITARAVEFLNGVIASVPLTPPSQTPPVTEASPFVLEAPPSKDEMEKIVARLGVYRRDVLQRGGMRPSKGFGIAAKWDKFLRKHAPNKSVGEYTALLADLDVMLSKSGEAVVVNFIEHEIVS